jgi:thiol-disulfide isomerase/thioredoxin
MRKAIYFISLLCLTISCKTVKMATDVSSQAPTPTETAVALPDYSQPSYWILGYFDPAQLREAPYSEWYLKGFSEYAYNESVIQTLKGINTDNLNIKVVMGTWCPDSRREVPRFMRILDEWDFPLSKVQFIGVDDAKRSPVGEYEGLGILRVPTFIIYKNNSEAGRIIENPTTSLEQDIVNILVKSE